MLEFPYDGGKIFIYAKAIVSILPTDDEECTMTLNDGNEYTIEMSAASVSVKVEAYLQAK